MHDDVKKLIESLLANAVHAGQQAQSTGIVVVVLGDHATIHIPPVSAPPANGAPPMA